MVMKKPAINIKQTQKRHRTLSTSYTLLTPFNQPNQKYNYGEKTTKRVSMNNVFYSHKTTTKSCRMYGSHKNRLVNE